MITKYDDAKIIASHLPNKCKSCGQTINPGELIFVNTEFDFLHSYCCIDCACIDCNTHTLGELTKIRRLSPDQRDYWKYFKGKPEECNCIECKAKRKHEIQPISPLSECQMLLLSDITQLSIKLIDKLNEFEASYKGYSQLYRWDSVIASIMHIAAMLKKENELIKKNNGE